MLVTDDDTNDELRLDFSTDESQELAIRNVKGDTSTRELITEAEIKDTYCSAKFDTVQYGTYNGRPACLIIMTYIFHASNPSVHRFRRATIEIKFTLPPSPAKPRAKPRPVEILSYAPEKAYGMLSFSKVTSKRQLSVPISIGNSLISASVTPKMSREEEALKGSRLVMEASERGQPPSRVVWSVVENEHSPDGLVGIPSRIRTVVIVGLKPDEDKFQATFRVEASVGWTVDPRRWPLLTRRDDPVWFDTTKPLMRSHAQLGPAFDELDLAAMLEQGQIGGRIEPVKTWVCA